MLCSLIKSKDVVNTAGPEISGTPIGTAPKLSASTADERFSVERISLIEIKKRRVPPATIKSATETPSNRRIAVPTTINASATIKAVIIDCKIIRLIFCGSISSVRLRNNGNTPMASTATKRGTKQSQNDFIIAKTSVFNSWMLLK